MDPDEYDEGVKLARHLVETQAQIDAHGFIVQCSWADDEGPHYFELVTIGLAKLDHPELLVTTTNRKVGHMILDRIGHGVVDSKWRLEPGRDFDEFGVKFRVIQCDLLLDESDPTNTVQVVWPGRDDEFPRSRDDWQRQPLMGDDLYWVDDEEDTDADSI